MYQTIATYTSMYAMDCVRYIHKGFRYLQVEADLLLRSRTRSEMLTNKRNNCCNLQSSYSHRLATPTGQQHPQGATCLCGV